MRRSAFALVSSLHRKLAFNARPLFYRSVKKSASACNNSSLEGWLGSCLKDSVILNLQKGLICADFSGEPLRHLCEEIIMTELEDDCDILANKDMIHAAINFFGCVLAFDRDDNAGIRQLVLPASREKLLDKLR